MLLFLQIDMQINYVWPYTPNMAYTVVYLKHYKDFYNGKKHKNKWKQKDLFTIIIQTSNISQLNDIQRP